MRPSELKNTPGGCAHTPKIQKGRDCGVTMPHQGILSSSPSSFIFLCLSQTSAHTLCKWKENNKEKSEKNSKYLELSGDFKIKIFGCLFHTVEDVIELCIFSQTVFLPDWNFSGTCVLPLKQSCSLHWKGKQGLAVVDSGNSMLCNAGPTWEDPGFMAQDRCEYPEKKNCIPLEQKFSFKIKYNIHT